VSQDVTHLVCSDDSSKIPIVTEEWLDELLGGDSATPWESAKSVVDLCRQANDIVDGESIQVKGKPYIMKTVAAFILATVLHGARFQSQKIDQRTCKHLREYLSESSEKERLLR
jgi:hypothetical protein